MKGDTYDSRIDNTDREPEREVEGRRVLLPDVQGQADRATMSAKMGGYAGEEGGEGTVRGEVWEREKRKVKSGKWKVKSGKRKVKSGKRKESRIKSGANKRRQTGIRCRDKKQRSWQRIDLEILDRYATLDVLGN